jgi:hypothetical protein
MAAYATCFAACGIAWAACYLKAGLVAGTIVASPAAPPAALLCNAAESVCMKACALSPVNLGMSILPYALPAVALGAYGVYKARVFMAMGVTM